MTYSPKVTHQIFVDESVRPEGYFLVSVGIPSNLIERLRREMRNALPSHGQQLHMCKETSVIRKRALSFVARLDLKVTAISNYRNGVSRVQARSECITKLCTLEIIQTASFLTFDSTNSWEIDRRILKSAAQSSANFFPTYRHVSSKSEPLLWLPDINAWSWGRGSDWKDQIRHLVNELIID